MHSPAGVPPEAWDAWKPAARRRVLLLVSLPAFLVPITTTIYLPSLVTIQHEFDTSATAVALTLSLYVLAAGVMALVYGPLVDRHGRRPVLLAALAIYVATSALCGLAWDIWSLAAARVLQAVGVSSSMVVGAAAISDVYPPAQRGRALGWFGVAPLIGPILGPPLGGAVAALAGWRAIFGVLAALGATVLAAVWFGLPETLHIVGGEAPVPRSPLAPFALLHDRGVLWLTLFGAVAFSAMYLTIALLPVQLDAVHGFGDRRIGLLFVPVGLAGLAGTLLGGRAADRWGHLRAMVVGGLLSPFGLLLFGYGIDDEALLWPALVGAALVSFAMSFARPGLIAAALRRCPGQAGAVSAIASFTGTLAAALTVLVATDAVDRWSTLVAAAPLALLVALSVWLLVAGRGYYALSDDERAA